MTATKLTNISTGSADVEIDGRFVGSVAREQVVRKGEFREDLFYR